MGVRGSSSFAPIEAYDHTPTWPFVYHDAQVGTREGAHRTKTIQADKPFSARSEHKIKKGKDDTNTACEFVVTNPGGFLCVFTDPLRGPARIFPLAEIPP